MPVNSRAKGARGERKVRDLYRDAGYEAERGQQRAGGADSPDVKIPALPWMHPEVKFMGACQLNSPAAIAEWRAQAERDAGTDKLPVIHHLWNNSRGCWIGICRKDWPVIWITWQDWIANLDRWREWGGK